MPLRLLHYKVFHFVRIEYQIELFKRLQALLNRQSTTHARFRSALLRKARSVLWLDFPPTDRSRIIVVRVNRSGLRQVANRNLTLCRH